MKLTPAVQQVLTALEAQDGDVDKVANSFGLSEGYVHRVKRHFYKPQGLGKVSASSMIQDYTQHLSPAVLKEIAAVRDIALAKAKVMLENGDFTPRDLTKLIEVLLKFDTAIFNGVQAVRNAEMYGNLSVTNVLNVTQKLQELPKETLEALAKQYIEGTYKVQ